MVKGTGLVAALDTRLGLPACLHFDFVLLQLDTRQQSARTEF